MNFPEATCLLCLACGQPLGMAPRSVMPASLWLDFQVVIQNSSITLKVAWSWMSVVYLHFQKLYVYVLRTRNTGNAKTQVPILRRFSMDNHMKSSTIFSIPV